MASALGTGRLPGRPRQTGQVSVLGGAPKASAQLQNILVLVASWTWISKPMTVSYWVAVVSVAVMSAGPPGRRVEADGLFQRVGRVEHAVLAERRARELEADGQPLAQACRDRDRGQAGQGDRHREVVVEVHLERVRGL